MEASRPILFILVQQCAFMSVDELWIHWVLCTSLLCFAWVAGPELDTCGRMAVYSQQPTTLLGILLSWCISTVVASHTNCRQVESCSLHCTASIFLALWVMCGPQGQTMEASRPILFILVQQCAFMSVDELWIHWVLCTSLLCFAWVAGPELDTCRRMAVYSQQPTTLLGILLSWCISTVVASHTNCRQVESCSLHCTASIFLALWGHVWPTRANHGSITSHLVRSCSAMCIHVNG